MISLRSATVLATCLIGLSACASGPHIHSHDTAPSMRLTLIPHDSVSAKKTTIVEAKINGIESRELITKEALSKPLQLLTIDSSLNDFRLITPDASKVPGRYSFSFTPSSANGYRVWADVNPTTPAPKAASEEFVMADLGAKHIGQIDKKESLESAVSGYHAALTFSAPLTDDEESTGTLKITDNTGNAVTIAGDIFGFYEDFHAILRAPVNADQTFKITPRKPGFIKLFAQIKIGDKTVSAPFSVIVKKAQ